MVNLNKELIAPCGMSEIENLEVIKKSGINYFLNLEGKRWVDLDGTYCVHDKKRYPQQS